MTEQEIPQDMNFTAGCLDGLMLLCLILTCMRIARSFGVEGGKKKGYETNHDLKKLWNMSSFWLKRGGDCSIVGSVPALLVLFEEQQTV